MEITVKTFETLVVDLIVFFLVILVYYTNFTTEMQKREWCYTYIHYNPCWCANSPSDLINRTLKVDPFDPKYFSSDESLNEIIWNNIERINEENKKIGIK